MLVTTIATLIQDTHCDRFWNLSPDRGGALARRRWWAPFHLSRNRRQQLHVFTPRLVGSLAGLTGIESEFFGEAAASLTGYAPSACQRQSGFNNLALGLTAPLAYALDWGPGADLALVRQPSLLGTFRRQCQMAQLRSSGRHLGACCRHLAYPNRCSDRSWQLMQDTRR